MAEQVFERGLATFVEVGEALMEIRDRRLYRPNPATRHQGYTNFEDCCRERWGMKRTRADQLIGAAGILKNLTTMVVAPKNERQVRPLTKLKDPEDQRAAWAAATEKAEREQREVFS